MQNAAFCESTMESNQCGDIVVHYAADHIATNAPIFALFIPAVPFQFFFRKTLLQGRWCNRYW